MKRLSVCCLMVAVLCLGIAPQLMATQKPSALAAVDLATAQSISDIEAQSIRGEGFWDYVKDRLKSSGDWRSTLMGPLIGTIYKFAPDKLRTKILNWWIDAVKSVISVSPGLHTIDLSQLNKMCGNKKGQINCIVLKKL